ncbi:MAG: DNA mismatch repair endonuclease MutL, partial [Bacilli bacterium]|nr:DNA mismatch repair endonuclease MutL [Bacilli bacterium]
MSKIFKLDQHTTNLIAAGEVIERAASVVKELVENSIDAQAKNINITLINAGQTEIIVSDDGIGMDAIDARMCVEPHSTSKIRNDQDLFRISTLGFRGEALPSIVAVSNFRLKTSVDGTKGLLYALRGGTFINEAVIACPKGTEISVRNLFFNTPARLQNLQSQTQELSHIVDYVNRIALARPDIAFKLINNDRLILQTFSNDNLLEVISQIYDADTARHMLPFFETIGYFQVSGYASDLNITRSSKSQITLVVNDRVIRNNALTNAVLAGYKERLVIGRYPIVVLKVVVDPALIDVNIHPAKHEVKFSNENELLNLTTHAITYALHDSDMIVEIEEKIDYQSTRKEQNQTNELEEKPPIFISDKFENEDSLLDLKSL